MVGGVLVLLEKHQPVGGVPVPSRRHRNVGGLSDPSERHRNVDVFLVDALRLYSASGRPSLPPIYVAGRAQRSRPNLAALRLRGSSRRDTRQGRWETFRQTRLRPPVRAHQFDVEVFAKVSRFKGRP
jgi:hypothetical protein